MIENDNILYVKSICDSTFTNNDGLKLKNAITEMLLEHNNVVLSFHNVSSISSSFLNSSFGELAYEIGHNSLKQRIKITNYTNTIISSIRKYVNSLAVEYV